MASSDDADTLESLETESPNELLAQTIDSLSSQELCEAFHREESRAIRAVACCLPTIASLLDELVPRLRDGGRLIYVGAGNSGRVGFMDCSELQATFSANPNQFLAIIAGGANAIVQAREEAEDSEADGATQMKLLEVDSRDTIIGISASGRTPFVIGALKVAIEANALTAAITNNRTAECIRINIKYEISAIVGPEFIAGSTRLKAGSAAKEILNMISTCSMVMLGKTYKGLMVDLRVNNEKLRARGRRIIRQVCYRGPLYLLGAKNSSSLQPQELTQTFKDNDALDLHIKLCDGSVKLACAVAISGFDLDTVKAELDLVEGSLYEFVKRLEKLMDPVNMQITSESEYFLAIDGGGTKCTVSIATSAAIVARATAGACNINCVSMEELVERIRDATGRALATLLKKHPRALGTDNTSAPRFRSVWAGIAGLYHGYNPNALTRHLEELFSASTNDRVLQITSDDMLLSACLGIDECVEHGISVIAGTGSVATAFRKMPDGEVVQIGRAGGWGHLIGDCGSAFDIGKMAIQLVLTSVEQNQGDSNYQLGDLEKATLEILGCTHQDLLSTILHHPKRQAKEIIADLARLVTKLGFKRYNPNEKALAILKSAASGLAKLIKPLAKKHICDPGTSLLILSGALLNIPEYRELVIDECLKIQVAPFKKIVVVDSPSDCAVQLLARSHNMK